MRRGGKILATTAVLAIAGCGEEGKLQIRPVSSSSAAVKKPVPLRVAEAHHQMSMGNVGLALEAFRKAAREDPNSVDAVAGMAACYDQMGRFDLSRRYYEAALALAPADPHVLGALAASLDLQGRREEATRVRSEIAARLAQASPPPIETSPQAEPVAAVARAETGPVEAAPRGQSVTVALPPPRPAPVEAAPAAARPEPRHAEAAPRGRSVTIALPPPRPAQVEASVAADRTERRPVEVPTNPEPRPIELAANPAKPEPRAIDVAPLGQSVTIALLPPPAPVKVAAVKATPDPRLTELAAIPPKTDPRPVEKAAAHARPEMSPVATPPRGRSVTALQPPRPAPETIAQRSGPRLERVSLGEVALITAPGPRWKAQMADRGGPRFVPLRQASYNQGPIRLLNAARVHRLAARTRSRLTGRGWAEITIGDAAIVRRRSLIVYPAGQRELATKLSAQTGIAMAERRGVRMVTILLGKDSGGHPELRNRSS